MTTNRNILGKVGTLALIGLSAFNIVACAASPEEQAAHTASVAAHTQRALARCQLDGAAPGYADRLTHALRHAYTENLDLLYQNGTTICLDQRIDAANQQHGGRRIRAIYYRAANTVGLVDNGQMPDSGHNYLYSSSSFINGLASRMESGRLADGPILIGQRVRVGKTTRSRWRDPAARTNLAERLAEQPFLRQAPLNPAAMQGAGV